MCLSESEAEVRASQERQEMVAKTRQAAELLSAKTDSKLFH